MPTVPLDPLRVPRNRERELLCHFFPGLSYPFPRGFRYFSTPRIELSRNPLRRSLCLLYSVYRHIPYMPNSLRTANGLPVIALLRFLHRTPSPRLPASGGQRIDLRRVATCRFFASDNDAFPRIVRSPSARQTRQPGHDDSLCLSLSLPVPRHFLAEYPAYRTVTPNRRCFLRSPQFHRTFRPKCHRIYDAWTGTKGEKPGEEQTGTRTEPSWPPTGGPCTPAK